MARPKGAPSYKTSQYQGVVGHHVDIFLDSFGARQAVCECGWKSGFWSTPRLAVDVWRDHAGVSE